MNSIYVFSRVFIQLMNGSNYYLQSKNVKVALNRARLLPFVDGIYVVERNLSTRQADYKDKDVLGHLYCYKLKMDLLL